MAKNRMTFEKAQREKLKKEKAEEKRVNRKKRKDPLPIERKFPSEPDVIDEP
jgi:hypothetical protein